MARIVLFALLLAAIALALASVMLALRTISPQHNGTSGDTMPKTFSNIAYVLLILLMFGVTSGWLGAS